MLPKDLSCLFPITWEHACGCGITLDYVHGSLLRQLWTVIAPKFGHIV